MTLKTVVAILIGVLLSAWQPASATGKDCAVAFTPKLSGFALNPVLDKLTVTSAKPKSSNDTCVLRQGDEILRLNEKKTVGSRALAVQRYWKSLKPGLPITFLVQRSGSVLTLTSK